MERMSRTECKVDHDIMKKLSHQFRLQVYVVFEFHILWGIAEA